MTTKIICELGLTEAEVQALCALIGETSGGSSECNDALDAVFMVLGRFMAKECIFGRSVNWNNSYGNIHIKGWE